MKSTKSERKGGTVILNGLLVGAVALALTTQSSAEAAPMPQPQDTAYAKQTSEGEVTLEVLPQWRDSVLAVEISANTHSVELADVNLLEQVRLVIDDVEVIPAEAGSLSGHHATATVLFRLEKRPERFAIQIRDVPDVPLRVLTWPAAGE
jgi:hypothetical protein